jgi:hypothetical protein
LDKHVSLLVKLQLWVMKFISKHPSQLLHWIEIRQRRKLETVELKVNNTKVLGEKPLKEILQN